MIRTFIVKSKDGADFSVQIYARSGAQAAIAEQTEARYAAGKTSEELVAHGDFHRVPSGATLTAMADAAPALPRRPVLQLIQGGLSAREYDTIDSLLNDKEIVLI